MATNLVVLLPYELLPASMLKTRRRTSDRGQKEESPAVINSMHSRNVLLAARCRASANCKSCERREPDRNQRQHQP